MAVGQNIHSKFSTQNFLVQAVDSPTLTYINSFRKNDRCRKSTALLVPSENLPPRGTLTTTATPTRVMAVSPHQGKKRKQNKKINTAMANSRSGGGCGNTERKNISEYEQSREERIKQNRERMQKLGIIDLSLQFKAHKPSTATRSRKPPPSRSTPLNPSPLPCPGPVRRSSR